MWPQPKGTWSHAAGLFCLLQMLTAAELTEQELSNWQVHARN